MTRVLDYAFSKPSPAAVSKAGFTGVMRYLSNDRAKNLTRVEAEALTRAGLDIGVVWETTAQRTLNGAAAGHADAIDAMTQAHTCGMPSDRPVYFAVDFDVTTSQMAHVLAYLDAARAAIGSHNVGVYGGIRAVRMAMSHGIQWGWQTYAWSAGQWYPGAQLQQYSNGHNVDGADCDYNRTAHDDYGQWRVGENPMALSPADKAWITGEIERVVWTGDTCPAPIPDPSNDTWQHESVLRNTYARSVDILTHLGALTEKVDALLSTPPKG